MVMASLLLATALALPVDQRCVFSMYVIEGAKQSGVSLRQATTRVMKAGVTALDVGLDEIKSAQQMCADGMRVESVYWEVRFLDPDNGEKTGDALLAGAKAVGSPRIMVLPQPFPEGADWNACMAKTIAGLRKLVARAKSAGITVTVEDFGNVRSPCARIRDLKALLDGVPELMLTLDAGNFYAIGEGEDPLEALKLFRDRIVHCHVKDYRRGAAGKWCPLGKGCIPNAQIVKALRESGYRGFFTIEESQAPDYLKAVEDAACQLAQYLK